MLTAGGKKWDAFVYFLFHIQDVCVDTYPKMIKLKASVLSKVTHWSLTDLSFLNVCSHPSISP